MINRVETGKIANEFKVLQEQAAFVQTNHGFYLLTQEARARRRELDEHCALVDLVQGLGITAGQTMRAKDRKASNCPEIAQDKDEMGLSVDLSGTIKERYRNIRTRVILGESGGFSLQVSGEYRSYYQTPKRGSYALVINHEGIITSMGFFPVIGDQLEKIAPPEEGKRLTPDQEEILSLSKDALSYYLNQQHLQR